MFPSSCMIAALVAGLPHAGGGVSIGRKINHALGRSSPRRWGCFSLLSLPRPFPDVFPTQVGVFLLLVLLSFLLCGLPHAGGGVSEFSQNPEFSLPSSPRRWGCFSGKLPQVSIPEVFPTQVGVFPALNGVISTLMRLPHAGGGVSLILLWVPCLPLSSPRRWGCFS